MKMEKILSTVTIVLAVIIASSGMGGCKKRAIKRVEGQWVCYGSELDHYFHDSAVRVWSGTDSLWLSTYVFGDSTIVISDRIVRIRSAGKYKFIITSMAYDGDWSSLKFDTVSYIGEQGNQREYHVKHSTVRNMHYTIDLLYDEESDKIHVVYDWSVLGPNYHDIGSKITLNGVRN